MTEQERKNVKWHPPKLGKYKLNFDGATRGNPGQSRARCIIRNWLGKTIGKLASPLQFGTENWEKLQAIALGLAWCLELKIKNICIEGDSLLIINAL